MRTKFKKAVIEAIHGLPYEEAIKKEDKYPHRPITIGRVMQALDDRHFIFSRHGNSIVLSDLVEAEILIEWKLTNKGKELTDDDQDDDTIKKLLELITQNK